MDVVYHAVTGLVVSKVFTGEYMTSAAIFAMLPDFIGATPYQYNRIMRSFDPSMTKFIQQYKKLENDGLFFTDIGKHMYRFTHSLFSLIPVSVIAYYINNLYWWVLVLSYFSHFLVDVPTHSDEFAQRWFYPISDVKFEGIAWWNNKIVWKLGWVMLLLMYFIVELSIR